jgi:[ribosomal protein S5]-alanine N-acetyltransferase
MLEFSFNPFPELETERLRLVRFSKKHFERMFEMRRHDEVMRYIERPRPAHIGEMDAFLEHHDSLINAGDGISWVVEIKSDGLLAGNVGFWRMKKEHHRAELGYMMLPEYWGKGIMSEALDAVLRYAFEVMKLHSIEADINPQNLASSKILERHGFTREAYFRENFYWEGKYLDSAIYSLLEQDYRANSIK